MGFVTPNNTFYYIWNNVELTAGRMDTLLKNAKGFRVWYRQMFLMSMGLMKRISMKKSSLQPRHIPPFFHIRLNMRG